MESGKRQRIKRDELAQAVFTLFARRYEAERANSVFEVELPLSEIRESLTRLFGVTYNSDAWILTQLRRYEKRMATRVFLRRGGSDDQTWVRLNPTMEGFWSKHRVYAGQKVCIANGVCDLIGNDTGGESGCIRLYLGSGSIPTHVCEVLLSRNREQHRQYRIYTHNLAVQQRVAEQRDPYVELYALGGVLDAVRYASYPQAVAPIVHEELDCVVQSTDAVNDGVLSVPHVREARVKREILLELPGAKVLTVIKDEFGREDATHTPFGALTDYDFVVTVPPVRDSRRAADVLLERDATIFAPYVRHWSYVVYRVNVAQGWRYPPEPRHAVGVSR